MSMRGGWRGVEGRRRDSRWRRRERMGLSGGGGAEGRREEEGPWMGRTGGSVGGKG